MVSTVAPDLDVPGQVLNVNADTAAAAVSLSTAVLPGEIPAASVREACWNRSAALVTALAKSGVARTGGSVMVVPVGITEIAVSAATSNVFARL